MGNQGNQGLSIKYYILMRKLRVLHGGIYRAYSTKKELMERRHSRQSISSLRVEANILFIERVNHFTN